MEIRVHKLWDLSHFSSWIAGVIGLKTLVLRFLYKAVDFQLTFVYILCAMCADCYLFAFLDVKFVNYILNGCFHGVSCLDSENSI